MSKTKKVLTPKRVKPAPPHVKKRLAEAAKGKPEHYLVLGKRIKALRISMGYASAEAFALDHELSRTHYGRWESGANITYSNLMMLIAIFGISVKKFFSEGFD